VRYVADRGRRQAKACSRPFAGVLADACTRVAGVARIYTGKGDDGTTSLWYGGRVEKTNARTEAYGALDEAASALGVARSLCDDDDELAADILRLQDDLFIAGAELATAPEAAGRLEDGITRVTDEMVDELEGLIDRHMERVDLPPKFVIPGGTQLSGQLDVARAVLRRAERRAVALKREDGIASDTLLRFLNRASDAAYALARAADVDDPELFAGRERKES
jgi:cob(I)alamin adenosyltransferase